MTSKKQEREALEKIRKIVESLGKDSYVATAFEGCFEIAEDNIENDFACSMKQRADKAEQEVAVMKKGFDNLMAAHNKQRDKAEKLEAELKEANQKALAPWLYKTIWMDYTDQVEQDTERMAQLAGTIVDMADTPKDIAFQHAVESYRKCRDRKENAERVIRSLELITPAGV